MRHLTFNTQVKLASPLGSETENHEELILCPCTFVLTHDFYPDVDYMTGIFFQSCTWGHFELRHQTLVLCWTTHVTTLMELFS